MKKQHKKLELRHERIVRLTDLHHIIGGALPHFSYYCTPSLIAAPPQYGTTIMGGPPTYNQGATVSC